MTSRPDRLEPNVYIRPAPRGAGRMPFRRVVVLTPVGLLVLVFLVWITRPGLPEERIHAAREAVSAARAAGADRYAPVDMARVDSSWSRTLRAARLEADRNPVMRTYAGVDSLAGAVLEQADLARSRSLTRQDSLRSLFVMQRESVGQRIRDMRATLDSLPRSADRRRMLSRAELSLQQADESTTEKAYDTALVQLRAARTLVDQLDRDAGHQLATYLENRPQWDRWVQETIRESRNTGKRALIVDKMNRQLHVYEKGKRIETWDVELGPAWMGDKRMEGDNKTPEGRYRVKTRKGAGATRYYRALEIDYPNADDRKAFADGKRTGQIPRNARIGGLIEIHGEGGKGDDWTNGCVALRNPDMVRLFTDTPTGTPVTIVGSMK